MGFDQDAALIEEVVHTRDPAFGQVDRTDLAGALAGMRAAAEGEETDAFLLAAMRVTALAGNAHSRVIPDRAISVLPLRIVLRDGVHCAVTEGGLAPIVAVNGVDVSVLSRAWRPYLAGPPVRQSVLSGLMLAWPAALVLGGVAGPEFEYTLGEGEALRFDVGACSTPDRFFSENETGALRPRQDAYPAPLIARDGPLWRMRIGDLKALSVEQVEDAVSTLRADPAGVVVDLRGNPGGSFLKALPLVRFLSDPAFGQRCAVLVNAYTFSAAIVTAVLIARHVGDAAALIGSEMGDDLAFWAEGDLLTLPQSGARLRYASAWHDWRTGHADATTPPEIATHLVAAGQLRIRAVPEAEQMAAARGFVLG
ncbi:MAG: hypothetical protein AAGF36_14010 [Pseudomonadota bacterium]